MIVIVLLIAMGILFEVLFFALLWPPWRSESPNMAWLLVSTSGALIAYDVMILLATLEIPVPPIPALLVLLGKDVLLGWRVKTVMRVRSSGRKKSQYRREVKSMNEILQLVPAKVRKYVYAVLALLGLVYGAWQAADGNWQVALGALVTTLLGALAQANVDTTAPPTGDHAVESRPDSY